jgi:hypothetical protein
MSKTDGSCEWGTCRHPTLMHLIPRDLGEQQAGTPKRTCGVHLFRLMAKMLNQPGVAFVEVCKIAPRA